MRKLLSILLTICLIVTFLPYVSFAEEKTNSDSTTNPTFDLTAQGAILMESSTGTILYQKNAHKQLRPASVTKIMTLNLVFDALESNKISLEDEVTISEHAASMGGSQVYLEAGEKQTVNDLIKCISIASANDACVALAEYIAGSEDEFVKAMNQKAEDLGMKDTHFVNCCGLDADGHLTSAYDIALMSREMLLNHPQIHDYCMTWMDTITHSTKRGESVFGLTNTNKLVKTYQYATGLKTGSTSLAKYSVSATAKKDNVELIAVILGAADYKVRFTEATTLLNYGFSKCKLYQDEDDLTFDPISVKGGTADSLTLYTKDKFSYVDTSDSDLTKIERSVTLPEKVNAPVVADSKIGTIDYSLNGKVIGQIPIYAKNSISKSTMKFCFLKVLSYFAI